MNQYCDHNYCLSISEWDQGAAQPSYNNITKSWIFVYDNGDSFSCLNNRRVVINWFCNMDITGANVALFNQTKDCQYFMHIQSKWACLGQLWQATTVSDGQSWIEMHFRVILVCSFIVIAILFVVCCILRIKYGRWSVQKSEKQKRWN